MTSCTRLFGIVDKEEEKVNSKDYDLKNWFSVWQIYRYNKPFFFAGSISSNCWNLRLKWQLYTIVWNAVVCNNSSIKVSRLQIIIFLFFLILILLEHGYKIRAHPCTLIQAFKLICYSMLEPYTHTVHMMYY